MIAELINRKQMKLEMKALLADAQIPPKVMLTLYLSIALVLNMVDSFMDSPGVFSIFISITSYPYHIENSRYCQEAPCHILSFRV